MYVIFVEKKMFVAVIVFLTKLSGMLLQNNKKNSILKFIHFSYSFPQEKCPFVLFPIGKIILFFTLFLHRNIHFFFSEETLDLIADRLKLIKDGRRDSTE
jgi:hypothetical protein